MLYHVWKSNVPPTLNQTTHLTDSVNKSKQEIKVHLLIYSEHCCTMWATKQDYYIRKALYEDGYVM